MTRAYPERWPEPLVCDGCDAQCDVWRYDVDEDGWGWSYEGSLRETDTGLWCPVCRSKGLHEECTP